MFRSLIAAVLLASALASVRARAPAADEQITWAVHVALAPTWFDPAETPGVITPFSTGARRRA